MIAERNCIPEKRVIVWIDFDPSIGKAIQKRRLRVMVSLYNFNCKTMFAIICPITSTVKKLSIRYSLPEDLDTNVKVLISQLKAFDFKKENEEKSKV